MAPKTKLTSFVPRLIFRAGMAGVIPACAVGCGSVSPNNDGSAAGGAGGGAGAGAGGAAGSGGSSGGNGGATGSGGAAGNRDGGAGGNTDARDAGRGGSGGRDATIIVLAIFGFANPPPPDEQEGPPSPADWLCGLDDLGPAMASTPAAGAPAKVSPAGKRRTRA